MRKLTKTAAIVASMAVMAMGTTMMASAAQEGWVQKGSDWYFYVNGNAVENQWALAGEKWYFLGDDGKMVKNAFIEDKEEYDGDLDSLEGGDVDDPVYYVGVDGAMITGWKEIDKNSIGGTSKPKAEKEWYYFGGSGMMFGEQWVESNGKWYYLGSDGKMVKNQWASSDDKEYYLGKDGIMISGWYKLTKDDAKENTETYDHNGPKLGEKDEWVYADDDEIISDGWKKVDGKWYLFGNYDAYEIVSRGAVKGVDTDYAMNEEVAIYKDKNWYYLKKNGAMETGWFSVKISGEKDPYKYYANSSGEIKCDGKISEVNGKNYYFYNAPAGENGYVGKYLDKKYVIQYEKDGKDIVLLDENGEVIQFDSRAKAQEGAEKNEEVSNSYKIYRLGTSTTYKETKTKKTN